MKKWARKRDRESNRGAAGRNSVSQGRKVSSHPEVRRMRTEKGVCGPSHGGFSGTPERAVLGESVVG